MDAFGRISQADHHGYYDWRNRFWQGSGLWLLIHPASVVFAVSLVATAIAIALGWPVLVCALMTGPALLALTVTGWKRACEVDARSAEQFRLRQLELEAEWAVEREEAIERARARRRETRP